MTSVLRCSTCGREPKYPVGPDTVGYTCALCAMGLICMYEKRREEELSSISPEDVKSFRLSQDPKMNQKDMDEWLNLPANHTNKFENGHVLPHRNLFNLIKNNLLPGGKRFKG